MGIWATPTATEEPKLTVVRWQIYEVIWPSLRELPADIDPKKYTDQMADHGVDVSNPENIHSKHLVAYCTERREGRVSTPIVQLDLKNAVVHTNSGRIYWLKGEEYPDADALYVLERWAKIIGAVKYQRVPICVSARNG